MIKFESTHQVVDHKLKVIRDREEKREERKKKLTL
jgi:tubulin polyglutamylase TTLL6/13